MNVLVTPSWLAKELCRQMHKYADANDGTDMWACPVLIHDSHGSFEYVEAKQWHRSMNPLVIRVDDSRALAFRSLDEALAWVQAHLERIFKIQQKAWAL